MRHAARQTPDTLEFLCLQQARFERAPVRDIHHAAHDAHDLSFVILDRDAGSGNPLQLAVGQHDAMLQRAIATGSHRLGEAFADARAIIRVDTLLDDEAQVGFGGFRRHAEDASRRLVPRAAAAAGLERPDAQSGGVQGHLQQRAALFQRGHVGGDHHQRGHVAIFDDWADASQIVPNLVGADAAERGVLLHGAGLARGPHRSTRALAELGRHVSVDGGAEDVLHFEAGGEPVQVQEIAVDGDARDEVGRAFEQQRQSAHLVL